MGYVATTGFIIYWKPEQPFFIHREHHFWFDEYNSHLSIEDKHNPGNLLLQQYPESPIHNLDLINLITCELDLTPTPFSKKKNYICNLVTSFWKEDWFLIYWIMKIL